MLDAERILGTLVDHEVRFVIVGALAATLHGSPLRTEDVDICPEPSLDNLERLGRALKALHAQEWDPHKGEFVDREWTSETLSVDLVWILGTSSGRLDLVFAPAGFDGFEHLAKNAIEQDIDGLRVTVASLEDVIRSKEQLNREKDRAQLPTLRRLLESIDERVESSDSGTQRRRAVNAIARAPSLAPGSPAPSTGRPAPNHEHDGQEDHPNHYQKARRIGFPNIGR